VVVVDRASIADFKDQALALVLGDNTADRLGDVAGRCHRQKPPPGFGSSASGCWSADDLLGGDEFQAQLRPRTSV
jgi:hypothetical protein